MTVLGHPWTVLGQNEIVLGQSMDIYFHGNFPKNYARLEYDMLCRLLCLMITQLLKLSKIFTQLFWREKIFFF